MNATSTYVHFQRSARDFFLSSKQTHTNKNHKRQIRNTKSAKHVISYTDIFRPLLHYDMSFAQLGCFVLERSIKD